jgi:hypothetical protein
VTGGAAFNLMPPGGALVFGINDGEAHHPYTVNFTQNSPEPSTLGLAAASPAGASALRRRKK